jgi:hypothetical protein
MQAAAQSNLSNEPIVPQEFLQADPQTACWNDLVPIGQENTVRLELAPKRQHEILDTCVRFARNYGMRYILRRLTVTEVRLDLDDLAIKLLAEKSFEGERDSLTIPDFSTELNPHATHVSLLVDTFNLALGKFPIVESHEILWEISIKLSEKTITVGIV